MSTQSDDIRTQVAEILKAAGVTFTAHYTGATTRDKWECDSWACSFVVNGRGERFDFYTGLGHRAEATKDAKLRVSYGFQRLNENDRKGLTSYGRRYLAEVEKLRKPQAPHAADVLHSLILDSSAVGQSFDSWCSDFGYDTDSRKAENIYRACQQNADKLTRVFNAEQREAIATTLQDY